MASFSWFKPHNQHKLRFQPSHLLSDHGGAPHSDSFMAGALGPLFSGKGCVEAMHPFHPINALSCSVCMAGMSPGKLELLGQDRTPGEAAACGQRQVCHRAMLLGGAERFVEQNRDLTTGKALVWMLLEVLLHTEVGTSLPPLLGKLGPWRTGTTEARQLCSLKEAAAEGFC